MHSSVREAKSVHNKEDINGDRGRDKKWCLGCLIVGDEMQRSSTNECGSLVGGTPV